MTKYKGKLFNAKRIGINEIDMIKFPKMAIIKENYQTK